VRGVERYQEHRRERWLNDDELKRLHEALDKYPDQQAANALRLIGLTGSRKGEVLKATWEEFDLDRGEPATADVLNDYKFVRIRTPCDFPLGTQIKNQDIIGRFRRRRREAREETKETKDL